MSLRSGATREPTPLTRWHVAHCPFAFVDGPPALRVADLHGRAARVEPGADERDDRIELRRLELERRHAALGDAGRDDPPDVVVRRDAAELAAPKIDAGDLIALLPMALLALGGVEPRAGLDFRGAVLMILHLRGACGHRGDAADRRISRQTNELLK